MQPNLAGLAQLAVRRLRAACAPPVSVTRVVCRLLDPPPGVCVVCVVRVQFVRAGCACAVCACAVCLRHLVGSLRALWY